MSETHTGIRSPMVHTTQNGAFRLIKTVRRFQRGVSRLAGEGDIRFIHVGKTGGSAVRHALGEWSGFSKRKLILHWHDLRFTDLPAGDQAIFFLRDPVGRFVSSFYSRQRRGRPRYDNPWSPDEAIAFSRFHTANELARALSAADAELREHAQDAMRGIRHVNQPYGWWFRDEASLLSRVDDIFFIGFQEQLADDFDRLRAMLGIPDRARLPDDEVLAHRAPDGTDRSLDPEAERNLRDWYAADLRLYEKCRDLVRTHPRLGGR